MELDSPHEIHVHRSSRDWSDVMNGKRISFAWINLSIVFAGDYVFNDYEPGMMYLASSRIDISRGFSSIGVM